MTQGEDLFTSLLDQAADVRQHQVSDASNATYISYLKSYEKCMLADFKKDPYPDRINKQKVITLQHFQNG